MLPATKPSSSATTKPFTVGGCRSSATTSTTTCNSSNRLFRNVEEEIKYSKADATTLLTKVREVVRTEIQKSNVFIDSNNNDNNNITGGVQQQHQHQDTATTTTCIIPQFDMNELVLGRILGRGGFCIVRELKEIQLLSNTGSSEHKNRIVVVKNYVKQRSSNSELTYDSSLSSKRRERDVVVQLNNNSQHSQQHATIMSCSREHLARRVWSKKGSKYVIKTVDPNLLQKDKVQFLKGTIDLALETKFLMSLQHPHIISIKGMYQQNDTTTMMNEQCSINNETQQQQQQPKDVYSSPSSSVSSLLSVFIIMDHLSETLPRRLNAWMQLYRATKGITGFITRGKKRANNLLTERLLVAYDIAEALDYLHSRNIIYRDLKPDNIGFNAEGVLKVFDFGLAKELMDCDRTAHGLYHMTGMTGAIRYMAPEVGLHQPYNLKADVYSWSMVFWYIIALEPPLGLYTPNMFVERVFHKGYRPGVNEKEWSSNITALMKRCWDNDIDVRPSFSDILCVLRNEIKQTDPKLGFIIGSSDAITYNSYDVQTESTAETSKRSISEPSS